MTPLSLPSSLLWQLSLVNNELGDEGGKAIGEALLVNASLTSVLAFAHIHTAPPPRTTRCANEHATLTPRFLPS